MQNTKELQAWYKKRVSQKLTLSVKDYRKGVNALNGEEETIILESLDFFPEVSYDELCNAFFNALKEKKLLMVNYE